jgi:two-component system, cell cycle sensor histidine kinase and response regulator CckA
VLNPVVLDLNSVVTDVERMLRRLIGERIDLLTNLGSNLGKVRADRTQIEQVIINLAVNARDAMPNGGKLTIETCNVEFDEAYAQTHPAISIGRYVLLVVTDSGMGMDKETQARIFEPFFTTKEHGKGTGLGLATVYGIVKQSGGFIWVYSEPDKGASFKVYLPRTDGEIDKNRQLPEDKNLRRGTESVLLVEDDDSVRAFTAEVLRSHGYKVLEAGSPQDALVLPDEEARGVQLLLTDVVMPTWNGAELARKLTARMPALKVLFMSGYTEGAIAHQGVLEENTVLLPKPFTPIQLLRAVRARLDGTASTSTPT